MYRFMKMGLLSLGLFCAAPASAYELVIPTLDYRTGPYAPNGIPFANGMTDYLRLLNERDGGIEGVPIKHIDCEFGYNTKQGLECYEKVKAKALLIQPLSTGLTYQLIPKARVDGVAIFSTGYGRTSAANGKVFPWIFNFPATYWDGAAAMIQYIAEQEGGLDTLKGRKIDLIHHNSAYGKEPIPTLKLLSEKYGFRLRLLPVDHPGQEQKATWWQVRRDKPDWILMWGWGVMNQIAIKEAASIRFPMDRFIGTWWSGSENDVLPAGKGAHGYKAAAVHAPGGDRPVHDDIRTYVYGRGQGTGDVSRVGEVLYNRGLVAAMWSAEAIRTAMKLHATKEVTPAMVRDGLEALSVDQARLKALGFGEGFTSDVTVTCANHAGPGRVAIQQWDAEKKQWSLISRYFERLDDVVWPFVEKDSNAYAKANGITPRTCN